MLVYHTAGRILLTHLRQRAEQLAAAIEAKAVVVMDELRRILRTEQRTVFSIARCGMNVQFLLYRTVDDGMLRYSRNLIAFIRMDMFLLPAVGVRRGVQRDGRKDQRIRRHEHHDAGGDREPPVPTLPQ